MVWVLRDGRQDGQFPPVAVQERVRLMEKQDSACIESRADSMLEWGMLFSMVNTCVR
jgi:hypothetical protein